MKRSILIISSYYIDIDQSYFIQTISNSFSVTVMDLTQLSTSRYKKIQLQKKITSSNPLIQIKRYIDLDQWKHDMSFYKNSPVFKNFTDQWEDWFIHLFLKKNQNHILLYLQNSNIYNQKYLNRPDFITRLINKIPRLFLNIHTVLQHLIFMFLKKLQLIPKIDTLFVSGKSELIALIQNKSINDFYFINDEVYDKFLDRSPPASEQFIVFLGQNFPYASYDLESHGEAPIDRQQYSLELLNALQKLSNYYHKEIIICAHPKYDLGYKENDFGAFKVVQGESNYYIENAALVIGHFSAALNYAVLLKKPIVLFTSDGFKNNIWVQESIATYESLLQTASYNMSYAIIENDLESLLKINHDKYHLFIHNAVSIYYPEPLSSSKILQRVINLKYFTEIDKGNT